MEEKQCKTQPEPQSKWESTLMFVALLMCIVLSIIGWYLKNDL